MSEKDIKNLCSTVGEIKGLIIGIEGHLKSLNGTVANNIKDINDLKIKNANLTGKWATFVGIVSFVAAGIFEFIIKRFFK